ncbi:hypothetical protein Tco_0511285 [Tanacetum coccineum]
MSDSEDSTVTYTEVSSPFEGLSDIRSLGFVRPEYEGLPWMLDDPYVQVVLQAPPSPDYVPGPEEQKHGTLLQDLCSRAVLESDSQGGSERRTDEEDLRRICRLSCDGGDEAMMEDESLMMDEA